MTFVDQRSSSNVPFVYFVFLFVHSTFYFLFPMLLFAMIRDSIKTSTVNCSARFPLSIVVGSLPILSVGVGFIGFLLQVRELCV